MEESESGSSADAPTAVVTAGEVQRSAAPPFEPPSCVDRYTLGELLGAGGLGVVYEAWDPELERRVAVKLVRTRSRRELRGSERFLREAQALARLSHPNVVAVYGVGRCDDGRTVFVVMEHIDGRTLRAWREEERRRVDEIVEVFLAAGRGLAAAHAAGIVHRDFKPDNVMVDREGRVRVLDFGLALAGGPGTVSIAAEEATDALPTDTSFEERLTQVGVVMGTPTYMAPEQHVGEPVGPASDQFSFCVAMLSSLREGAPIFIGRTPREIAAAKARGRIEPRAANDDTPRWIEAALLRGLRVDPAERWPSMDALLTALERRPSRRLRLVTLGAVAAASVGVLLATRPGEGDCTHGADRLAQAYADERDAAARTTRTATGARASQSLERFETQFEDDARAWHDGFVATCRAHASGGLDDLGFDRRMACLRSRAAARERLLASFARDPEAAAEVPEALVELRPIADCVDDDGTVVADVLAPVPPDPQVRAAVERVREEIRGLDERVRDGAFEASAGRLEALEARAEALGFEPLVAEVLYARGRLEAERTNNEEAVALFEEALTRAEAAGHDYLAAALAGDLVFLYAKVRRLEDAEEYLARAKALADRVGSPQPLVDDIAAGAMALYSRQQRYDEALAAIQGALPSRPPRTIAERFHDSVSLNNLALVHLRIGENRRAQALLLEALALREEALGEDHPKLGTLHLNIAKAMARNGNYADAEDHASRALALSSAYGDAHDGVASALIARGVVRKKMGRFDEARADYEDALARVREAGRPVAEAMLLANLGNLEKRVGNLQRAMDLHAQALAMREAELGSDALDVASSLGDIGALHRRLKHFDLAREHFDRDLAIKRKALGDDHPELVRVWLHRANLALDEDDLSAAREDLEEALRIVRLQGVEDTSAASSFEALGRLELAAGDHDAAVSAFREAIERHALQTGNPGELGGARLGLAKALWELGRSGEARDALSAARVELREGGDGVAEQLAELETIAEAWSGPMPKPPG